MASKYTTDDMTNRYLFRNAIAGNRYQAFLDIPVLDCFHFVPPSHPNPHTNFITAELERCLSHWNLNFLVNFHYVYYDTVVRLFYANGYIDGRGNYKSYLFGKEIIVSESLLCDLFQLGDFGLDEYVGVSAGTVGGAFTITPLPFVRMEDQAKILRHVTKNYEFTHPTLFYPSLRGMFDIIDRILVPKRFNEINLMNAYYLRHIWHLEKQINIPYVIIQHMNSVKSHMLYLPYGNMITSICIHFGIQIPFEEMRMPCKRSQNILSANGLREYGLYPHANGWYIRDPSPMYILPHLDENGNAIPDTKAINFICPNFAKRS